MFQRTAVGSLQIRKLIEALKESDYYSDDLPVNPGFFTLHIEYALKRKFLKDNNAINVRRVIGRLRVIDPVFNKMVPPGTDFITEDVKNATKDFLQRNYQDSLTNLIAHPRRPADIAV